jgi:hypothetical protein
VLARRLSAGQPGAASDRRIARVYGALPGILSGPVASLAGGGAGEFACGLWSATRVNWFPMLGGALEAVDDARASRAAAEIVSSLAAATGGRTMRYRVGATASSEAAGVAYVDGPRVRAPLVTSPACGSIARTLLCTGDARGVRELVRGRARSFARSACYRDVAARLRAPRGLLVVADLPAIVDRAFEPYARLAIARIFAGARVERAELPPGAFVGRHLEAVGASFMVEPDAIRVSSVTPAGLALTVGACAYLVESVMGGGDAAPSRPLPPSPPPPAREEAAGQDEF